MDICLVDLQWEGHHIPYVNYISKYLTDNGHEVTFLTSNQNPRITDIQSRSAINVRKINATRRAVTENSIIDSICARFVHTRNIGKLYYSIYPEQFDIIHFLYYDNMQIAHTMAGKLIQKATAAVVMSMHRDMFLQDNSNHLSEHVSRGVTAMCMSLCLDQSLIDNITVHASSIKHRLIGGVPAANRSNITVLPAPTPRPTQNISTAKARTRLNIRQDADVILFFGQIRHEKGLDRLCMALQESEAELTVVIAGNPEDYSRSQILTWVQELPDCVSVDMRCEYIPEDIIDSYFCAADALVLPYRRKTGISGPLRRAAFAGTLAIVPTESDIGEIVRQHNLGVTFNSNSELRYILSDIRTHLSDIDQESLVAFGRSRHWKKKRGKDLRRFTKMRISSHYSSAVHI